MSEHAALDRLTQRQKYDLYHAIQAENPTASKDEVRRLYRATLRAKAAD